MDRTVRTPKITRYLLSQRLTPTPSILKPWIVSLGMVTVGLVSCAPPQQISVHAQERSSATATQRSANRDRDVDALVNLGPRVAGTPIMEQASAYLIEEYRKVGYVATVQTFTYAKFIDQGSSLTVDGTAIQGRALQGTSAGDPTARLVAVPNLGRAADFATTNGKGAIAIVQRGEIPFAEKAQNAAAAGAIGLVIVNNRPGSFSGNLTGESTIPVLALSSEQGQPLLERSRRESLNATLTVNARRQEITGRNVIAHLEGVTQPKVLLGGHYDSVLGSPGANDNASGTAVVLAIARHLSRTPLARDAWFVAFDGEEDGLHGSRAFVKSATPPFLKGLKGMLNFDMVGVNNSLQVGGTSSLTQLAQVANSQLSTLGSSSGSDHASFAAAGVPVLFFHRGLDPNYHSPNDKTVDSKLLDETTQAGLNVIKRLLIPSPG